MFLTSLLKEAMSLDWGVVFLGIFVICGLFKLVDGFFVQIKQRFGISFASEQNRAEDHKAIAECVDTIAALQEHLATLETTMATMTKVLEDIQSKSQSIEDSNKLLNEAVIEILYDRISLKCKYYINELKGIPEDEVESFNRMFNIYKSLGGNHGLDRKVAYCNNHLNILPPDVKPEDKE